MRTVLFLCRENACRSQMAEGLARELFPDGLRAYSAGSSPRGSVDPIAIEVMREVGIDLRTQHSKSLEAIPHEVIDCVVTLCAEEECPVFPGDVERLHWPLPDPAAATGSTGAVQAAYRSARDELTRRIRQLARGHAHEPPA